MEEDTIEFSMAEWDRAVVQAAEQTAHPSAVGAGGGATASRRVPACIDIDEQPVLVELKIEIEAQDGA